MSKPSHEKKSAGTTKGNNSLTKVVVPVDSGSWIKPNTGDKFYIEDNATFPSIIFEIDTTFAAPYKWEWSISWDAKVSGLSEKSRGKKLKTFSDKGSLETNVKSWDAVDIGKVIGGTLIVKVTAGTDKFKRTVHVFAKQPTQTVIEAYLVEKSASALNKIIKQESKYKHVINADNQPVVAFDGGYSLTQMTNPAPTYEQVWCWKKNADAAIALVNVKKKTAEAYLSGQGKSSYTSDMLELETLARWNGGAYHKWNGKVWIRNPDILCDSQTGNVGWNTTNNKNQSQTETELRKRDTDKNGKRIVRSESHPWLYTGVCYADHLTSQ